MAGYLDTLILEAAAARRRRVFFSFHYADIFRVNNVRNSGQFATSAAAAGRHVEGYYDKSLWEKKKLEGEDALRRMIRQGVKNTSVVCVLAGTYTFLRPWVRYEIARSVINNKGLLTVHINRLPGHSAPYAAERLGSNPCDFMGIQQGTNGKYYLCEKNYINNQFIWQLYRRHSDPVSLPKCMAPPSQSYPTPLSQYAVVHDWMNNGYRDIGIWLDAAARQIGR